MSRTYRMTKRGFKTDWLPDWFTIYGEIRSKYEKGWIGFYAAETDWQRLRNSNPDLYYNWFLGQGEPGPKWFRNARTTRPRRAQERRLLKKIKDGYFDADNVVFPKHGRPQIYWT